MNAGTGVAYANSATGDQLGRIDIAVAPTDPNVIYAQVQSIAEQRQRLRRASRLPARRLATTTAARPGTSWPARRAARSRLRLRRRATIQQNWYDQGIAVDPNNPDRVFVDTFDVWFATRTGAPVQRRHLRLQRRRPAVHVDQHALAFVPGSSDLLLVGSDGGIFGSTNADTASATGDRLLQHGHRPEHDRVLLRRHQRQLRRRGAPLANGGAQDNGPSVGRLPASPTGPAAVADGTGGDGF